jgi:hypothetical protein
MNWESPVSYNAKSMTRATREILEGLDVLYTRESTHSVYGRFVVAIPLADKFAYTYVFKFHHPNEFELHYYDSKPGHSGIMPFMRIRKYQEEDVPFIKELLKRLLVYFEERPPWKFPFAARLMHGLIIPEFWQAKRAWDEFDALKFTKEEKEKYQVEKGKSGSKGLGEGEWGKKE